MPMCRSPLYLPENADKKEMEEAYMPKKYYLYVRGQKEKVSEQIYKNQHNQWIVNIKNSFIIKC